MRIRSGGQEADKADLLGDVLEGGADALAYDNLVEWHVFEAGE